MPGEEPRPGIVAVVAPGGKTRDVADDLWFPNGMAITPDGSTLIVAESHAHRLTAFTIAADGSLTDRRTWADLGEEAAPDGICLDAEGAVWYADVPNKHCRRVSEGGRELETVQVDRGCFACMLGGPDGRTLHIVATDWEQLDWQHGGSLINLTKFLYDLGSNTADYAEPITVGTLQTTKGPNRLRLFPKQTAMYVEDASFLKLREVTLSVELPSTMVSRFWRGVRTAELSFSGRNLWTHTDYTGMDPEVSNFGNQPIGRNIDVGPFPPSRSFWFSVTLGF